MLTMAAWIVKRNQELNAAVSAFIGKGNNNVEFSPPLAPPPKKKKKERKKKR